MKRINHRVDPIFGIDSKRCGKCKNWLPTTEFGPNKSMWDGLCGICKTCRSTERKNVRIEALKAYSSGDTPTCACCGVDKIEFLALDHIYGGGNKERKAVASGCSTNFFRWLKRNSWPSGYQVLCHNCNVARGVYGKCPCEGILNTATRLWNRPDKGGWITCKDPIFLHQKH